MSDSTHLSREQAEALAKRVLGFSTADQARVNISSGWRGNTRFAVSAISTSGHTTDTTVTVTSTIGRRRASATTNVLDDASLRRTVELSERLARLSPEDPELMPELEPQPHQPVRAFVESTAQLTPAARALAVQRVIDAARGVDPSVDVSVAGFLEANAGARAVATSKGLFGYHASTDVDLTTTARTADGTGSGWAAAGSRDWRQLDPAAIGRRAGEKALASRNPVAIEPGRYTVILEPRAVADLVPILLGSFNARTADEGRSPFSKPGGGNKVGEKIMDERITISSDPFDPELPGSPFDGEGLPSQRVTWVENGVLRNLDYSRFWAQKQGRPPTGSGGGLRMSGGTKSVDELIAGTERGILVTHFFYIRFLDQRTVLLTGLTRDGTFLVENGKVTKSLKNFRWNESPLFMLNKIDELGRPERISSNLVLPPIRARDFTFTSLSDAV